MQLICYLSNGFPSNDQMFQTAASYVEGGCDIIEVDLPTSNPFLDGELIQQRMKASYEMDPTLQQHIQNILELRRRFPTQKLLLLAYEHTVLQIGVQQFIELYQTVLPEAVILVAPENETVQSQLMQEGVRVASYVPFDLPSESIQQARQSNGFIYLQAKTDKVDVPYGTLKEVIAQLRNLELKHPIYCGVGISTPQDIQMVKEAGGDAAFVGSVILKKEHHKADLIDYISLLKKQTI